ncbi:MAG: hypothetical protein GF315_09010 [candidate division Zixibacteria bacterium]|nr:hypothetical protein [candidate division Zixibacteria bacterium]
MNSSLDAIFRPKSIAVIGASTKKHSIGYEIFRNIIRNEFTGKVFPVNPKADVVHSMKCYNSISEIPDEIDLAIIIVARRFVLETAEDCGKKGVKAIVVISGGFKETGEEGAKLEQELLKIVKKYKMRMVGPNCFGIANFSPDYSLDGTFSKMKSLYGKIGFISQSGALGQVIMEYARSLNFGFSMFASIGNKADISSNDILTYWQDDPEVEIILLYLENFGNPSKFTQIARQITKKKPIICVKAGRTEQGARAVSSHTGVLSNLDVGVDALFEQCGVIRADSIEDMFDTAVALHNRDIPRGDRVGVITNAGGPAILATDALINHGLKVPALAEESQKYLKESLMEVAAVSNPVDVIASGGPDAYRASMETMMSDENIDVLFVIFVPPIMIDHRAVIETIIDVHQHGDKPVYVCFMGPHEQIDGVERLIHENIAVYLFPEYFAKTLSVLAKYRKWVIKEEGAFREFTADKRRVKEIIDLAKSENRKSLIGPEAIDILKAYGIPTPDYELVSDIVDLSNAVQEIEFPLVMKINKPLVLHKTDQGGVVTDIRTSKEAREAFDMLQRSFAAGDEFEILIQRQVRSGIETVMGMTHDPSFGPLMMFGLGGIYVEVMKDVSFKIHPITDLDAREMIEAVKGYPLLTGYRGSKPVYIESLIETLMRLSQLITDFGELDQFDVNPFIVSADPKNCCAVDARFILK